MSDVMVVEDDLVAAARKLGPGLRERARETENLRRIPDETIAELHAAGLFRVLQPARYGGVEANPATFADVVMALSSADASVGWVYGVLGVHIWMTALLPEPTIEEVWGDDPSTLVAAATFPREGGVDKVEGGYRVAGRFGFASGCHHAGWSAIIGGVRNEPEAGFVGFLMPRKDYEIVDNWHVMGMCGTGSCDLAADTVVPDHRVIHLTASGSSVSDAALYRLPFLTLFSHSAMFPLLGIAEGALDDYIAGQRDRVTLFGSNVAADMSTQVQVAESAAEIDAARLAVRRNLADLMSVAEAGGTPSLELLARADRDQILAARHAVAAVDRIFATSGGRALSLDNPLQRAWRDIHAGAAHAGNQPNFRLAGYGAQAFGLTPGIPH